MSTTRRFCCDDLLKFNNVNLDVLTETVSVPVGEGRGFPNRGVASRSSRDFCFFFTENMGPLTLHHANVDTAAAAAVPSGGCIGGTTYVY